MALPLTEATASSKNNFDPKIKQQIYEGCFLMEWMKKNKQVTEGGGRNIQVPVRYRKLSQAEAADPRSQFVFESRTTRTGYEQPWKYYRVRTLCHWDEMNENSGPGEIFDLMGEKATEMTEDLQDLLFRDLWATSEGTYNFTPMSIIIDSSSAFPTGQIDPTDAPAWASVEDSSTTKVIPYGSGSISDMVDQATFGKNFPQMHVTTRALRTAFEGILEPSKVTESDAAASLGYDSVAFRKKPVVGDAFVPTSAWYGIDTKQIELKVHKNDNMDIGDWFSLEQAGFPKTMGRYGTWVGNWICRMRKTSFKMTALDYTL